LAGFLSSEEFTGQFLGLSSGGRQRGVTTNIATIISILKGVYTCFLLQWYATHFK